MRHILVVDDDKTNLISAKNALGDEYKVVAVSSGAQTLNYLKKYSCDLILLDINMPGMDGFEVLKRIRENNELSQIPIFFLTANQERQSVMEGIKLGINDYIAKPFVTSELQKRVRRVFNKGMTGLPSTDEELQRYLSDILEDLREGFTSQAIAKLEKTLKLLKQ